MAPQHEQSVSGTRQCDVHQRPRVRVEIYIDTGDKEDTKRVFDAVVTEKAALEKQFGAPLSWERLDERRASRIAIYREGRIEGEKEKLKELRKWLIEQLLKLKAAIGPRVDTVAR